MNDPIRSAEEYLETKIAELEAKVAAYIKAVGQLELEKGFLKTYCEMSVAEKIKAQEERDALKKRLEGAMLGVVTLPIENPKPCLVRVKPYREKDEEQLYSILLKRTVPTVGHDVLILPAEENNSHQTKESAFTPEQIREINQTHQTI